MTDIYDWNPMPHRVDVLCPECRGHAVFEFAEVVKINKVVDIPFFKTSDQFEYRRFQDSCGHFWHGAIYYAGLHGNPVISIHGLPAGYAPSDWAHSKYLFRSHRTDIGAIVCLKCGKRSKHRLNWPGDAYYAVRYKGKLLWAFNSETALELCEYLSGKIRDLTKYRWRRFLLHVPSIFKGRKARHEVTKQLIRLLKE